MSASKEARTYAKDYMERNGLYTDCDIEASELYPIFAEAIDSYGKACFERARDKYKGIVTDLICELKQARTTPFHSFTVHENELKIQSCHICRRFDDIGRLIKRAEAIKSLAYEQEKEGGDE